MSGLTTDDHTCVLLLDDVLLRQVLAARDPDDRAMLVRLNLASSGAHGRTDRLIGRGRHAVAAAPDRPRHVSTAHPAAGRHAATDGSHDAATPQHSAAA